MIRLLWPFGLFYVFAMAAIAFVPPWLGWAIAAAFVIGGATMHIESTIVEPLKADLARVSGHLEGIEHLLADELKRQHEGRLASEGRDPQGSFLKSS